MNIRRVLAAIALAVVAGVTGLALASPATAGNILHRKCAYDCPPPTTCSTTTTTAPSTTTTVALPTSTVAPSSTTTTQPQATTTTAAPPAVAAAAAAETARPVAVRAEPAFTG